MPQAHDSRRSKWAWDTQENRRIYVGNKSEWDPEETRRQRWTDPIVPGATKAPWGTAVYDSGRLRCCPDLCECGVQVKVIQASIQDWHYKRVWNRGKNSKYQFKCKNEANVSGVSRFHHTVVNEIHRCLAEERPVLGKTIAELPPPELPVRELAGKAPDVFVKFDDGSYLAIEVVYTHAPDREVHEQYQENMVDIRLKELDEIHDDAVFNRWVQADGVWDLFLAEAEPAQRRARWEARQRVFDVKDEQEYLREVEQRISSCREKFGFPYGGDETTVVDLDDIDAWFEEERENRERQEEIRAAIIANEKKYQMKFEGDPSIFGRKKDVDDYFAEQNKPLIEEWEAERKALEEELGVEIPAKYVTSQQMNDFADEKRREAEEERLNEILPPLIKELEEEVPGIKVNHRFSSLEEFEEYAQQEREGFAARQQAQSLSKRIKERYEADVEKLGVEYDTWLAQNTKSNAYTSRRINEFIQTAERLLTREYHFKRWQRGYRPAHLVTGNVEGPGPHESSLCRELDKFCKNKDDHTCYSLRSEAAGSLVGCMKLDRNDLRFERIKLFVKADGLVSWRSRGSIRETREERVKEAQANVERAALALAIKEKREDDERKKRRKGNQAMPPIRRSGRRMDSALAQKGQDEGDQQDTE